MARDTTLNQAARRTLPGNPGSLDVNATSSTTLTLSSYIDQWVLLQAKGADIYISPNSSTGTGVTATTASPFLIADQPWQEFFVTDDKQYVGLLGSASGTLIYAETGE